MEAVLKQVGIDRDCIEFREQRKQYQREAAALRRSERYRSIRNWFFTPRGALVYFGVAYAALAIWLLWVSHS